MHCRLRYTLFFAMAVRNCAGRTVTMPGLKGSWAQAKKESSSDSLEWVGWCTIFVCKLRRRGDLTACNG